MINWHKSDTLRLDNGSFYVFLLLLAQSGDVATVNATGERALELRQKPSVFIVGLDVQTAKDALFALACKWIFNCDGIVRIC